MHPTAKSGKGLGVGFRAYSASKLCNLLTARALANSDEMGSLGLTVTAYNRDRRRALPSSVVWPLSARFLMGIISLVHPIASFATVEQAGSELTDLALGRTKRPTRNVYASPVRRRLT